MQGEVTEAGLKVRFGRLGLIDVAFTPTKTLSMTEPSEGCEGEPRTLREGFFTGTIDCTGEREYVRGSRGPRLSLLALGCRCNCYFSAGVHFGKRKARSIFYGLKAERREGMEIVRGVAAHAGASAFVFDHAAGTATVRPPRPFRGQATFKRRPGDRPCGAARSGCRFSVPHPSTPKALTSL